VEDLQRRRVSFGSVAEVYDQARPSYPVELVNDLVTLIGAPPNSIRAVEIGAGTGKATALFAAEGITIEAIEPSAEMAEVARRRLARFPNVTVTESEFEPWVNEGEPVDLIFSAQAWHWIDPLRRYRLARAALRDGGVLCPIWNSPLWSECRLRDELDEVYARHAPELSAYSPMRPHNPGPERGIAADLEAISFFETPETWTYRWDAVYTTDEYTALLSTHSDHILLSADRREALLGAVAAVLDGAGGQIKLPHVTVAGVTRAC
jgi:SAM-dependent methyltransferase